MSRTATRRLALAVAMASLVVVLPRETRADMADQTHSAPTVQAACEPSPHFIADGARRRAREGHDLTRGELMALAALAAETTSSETESLRNDLHRLDAILGALGSPFRPNLDELDSLNHDQLSLVYIAIPDYAAWQDQIAAAEAALGGSVLNQAPPLSSPLLPVFVTPTPNATPLLPEQPLPTAMPGPDTWQPDDEEEGLYPADYWDGQFCANLGITTERSDANVLFVFKVLYDVLDTATNVIEQFCKLDVEALGNAANADRCAIFMTMKFISVAMNTAIAAVEYCDGLVQVAEIEAMYENTKRILARLRSHEIRTMQDIYRTHLFLRDFRELHARLLIEASLASVDENPDLLLTLPGDFCRDLPGLPSESYPDGPDRLECGLLEHVQRIVAETIVLMQEAGQSVNNAQAEYDAGVALFSTGDYKAAYSRFRKAYREAVSSRSH